MQLPKPLPEKPMDRRVQRTRDALRGALMGLMVDIGWDAIEVQMLCERANIGRSTFYQHYPSKESLLNASFSDLRDGLMQGAMSTQVSSQGMPFLPGLLAHVHEAQEVFRALLGRRSGHYVQDRFKELLIELLDKESAGAKTPLWQLSARSHYLAGALFEMLVWWLGSNRPHTAAEIEALFRQWSQSAG